MSANNPHGKTVDREHAHEIWTDDAGWTWYVLRKYGTNDAKPFARWYCCVTSPFVPDGEYGDVYVSDIKRRARFVRGAKGGK